MRCALADADPHLPGVFPRNGESGTPHLGEHAQLLALDAAAVDGDGGDGRESDLAPFDPQRYIATYCGRWYLRHQP